MMHKQLSGRPVNREMQGEVSRGQEPRRMVTRGLLKKEGEGRSEGSRRSGGKDRCGRQQSPTAHFRVRATPYADLHHDSTTPLATGMFAGIGCQV